jgi:glucokinase
MILAGDIGGTKTRLALYQPGHPPVATVERTFPSGEHPSLEAIVTLFRAEQIAPIEAASFGVAGPVRDGRSETTNLPWLIETTTLAALLDLPADRVGLLNDLEASAWGLAALGPADLMTLSPGSPGARGNSAMIAAGTGLGEAGLFWDGRRHRPFATEGGHADFAPRTEVEDALAQWLRGRYGRVSWERVVSGPGLVNLHAFLCDTRQAPAPAWLAEEMRAGDPAAAISNAARDGKDPVASEALDLFVTLYGAEAGDLALKMMATGGLYVGGGIAPRIAGRIAAGGFMAAFMAKGRMRPLMESMPVHVVLNDRTALLGAARHAMRD